MSGRFRRQYNCTQYNAIRTECEDVNNGFQSIGDNMIYMDRQRVTCPSGKMMTSYKPSTRGKDTTIHSRCCKAQGIFPTMQPKPMPGTNPNFVPTHQPVAIPTEIPITTYEFESHQIKYMEYASKGLESLEKTIHIPTDIQTSFRPYVTQKTFYFGTDKY